MDDACIFSGISSIYLKIQDYAVSNVFWEEISSKWIISQTEAVGTINFLLLTRQIKQINYYFAGSTLKLTILFI